MRSAIIWIWFVIGVAGCATIHNPLSDQEISDLKIVEVRVTYAPNAMIWWGAAERAYNATLPKPNVGEAKEVAADSPEMTEHLRKRLADLVRETLMQRVSPLFQKGQRAVVLESRIVGMTIPSEIQRVVIGGAPVFAASTHLIDVKTGQEIGKLDRGTAPTYTPNGALALVSMAIGENAPEAQLMGIYVEQVLSWLLKK